jgi:AraC-like DNA-binding protein
VTVLFDTATLEPADRPDSWTDAHRRIFFPIGVRFTEADTPSGTIEQQGIGPVRAFRVCSQPSVIERSAAEVRSFDPGDFLVGTLLRGRTGIEQAGRSGLLGPRDVSSWDSSRPFRVTHFEPFELLLLVVPEQLLGLRRKAMQARTASRLAPGTGLASLAARFFSDVWDVADRDPGCRRDDLADGVVSLVRALHGHETAQHPPTRQLAGDLLLSQIRSFIEGNLDDPSLGPRSIARAHFISTRYVHKLFSRDGVSVSDWVRHRRLEACRRVLMDPAQASLTVTEVARQWTFTSPTHFSRIFRETYGCTPTECRRDALAAISVRQPFTLGTGLCAVATSRRRRPAVLCAAKGFPRGELES